MAKSAGSRAEAAAVLAVVARTAGLPGRQAERTPARWSPEQRASVADLAGTVAVEAVEAARTFLAVAIEQPDLPARDRRDLAGAARDAAVVAGILIDKANLITGLATQRIERVDADELRRRLAALLTVPSVELPAAVAAPPVE